MVVLNFMFNMFHFMIMAILFYRNEHVRSFNIDTKSKVLFSGNADSYFGFSVVLAGNKWLLIGAPRDRSLDLPSTDHPGALYRCHVSDGKSSCMEIRIDGKSGSDSAEVDGKQLYFDHGRTGQWLGCSLQLKGTVTAWEIVTCAHRWYNRRFVRDGEYDMNGLCYIIPSDLSVVNIKKVPAMVGSAKRTAKPSWGQSVYNYGMAAMGISLHVTHENQNILIGAPGIKDWTGGFVEMAGKYFNYMESDVDRVNDTHDSYIGYAMTSGRYFSDRQVYIVAGAPRINLIGQVLFFRSDKSAFVLEQADFELVPRMKDQQGFPVNAYFGSALCTVDVNADGSDDLLVGAPMLAYDPYDSDVGGVLLYLGTSVRISILTMTPLFGSKFSVRFRPSPEICTESASLHRFVLSDLLLNGSKVSRGRFGSAISSLGDINSDGFNDVVVGAPYEDNERGAVYIYNGYKDGLWPRHSLKILARTLDESLLGFGASFSNEMDMNRDNINDLAIGSYLSNNVVLLYGQPVIYMDAWIKVTVAGLELERRQQAMIKRNAAEIKIQTCFKFTNTDTQSLSMTVLLTLDSGFEPKPRLLFKKSNSQERQLKVKVWKGDTTCTTPAEDDHAYAHSTTNLVAPVVLLARYEIETVRNSGSDVQPTLNKFNGKNPKDPLLEVRRNLNFRKDCDNNICNTDLHLNATLQFRDIDGFFIKGMTLMSVLVRVTKDGDPSYGSECLLTFPKFLRFKKIEQLSGATDVSCSVEKIADNIESVQGYLPKKHNSTLRCDFGNPLYSDSGVEFLVHLQVPTQLLEPVLKMDIKAETMSGEANLADNHKEFVVEVRNHVRAASLSGISDPHTMFIKEDRDPYISKHIYEFANQGPSSLPQTTVTYFLPPLQRGQGSQPDLFLNSSIFKYSRETDISCLYHQLQNSPPLYIWLNGRLKVFENQAGALTADNDCTSKDCSYIKCNVTNIPARTTLVTTLIFVIHNSLMEGKTLRLLSKGLVLLDETNLITKTLRFEKTLITELLPETPKQEKVDLWVIIVSVTVGVVLLVILMFILYKVGFFKRNIKVELERQKLEKTNSIRSTHLEKNQENGKDHITSSEINLIDDDNPKETKV